VSDHPAGIALRAADRAAIIRGTVRDNSGVARAFIK